MTYRDGRTQTSGESVRLYTQDEMVDPLTSTGVVIRHRFPGYRGQEPTDDAARHFVSAYRP